MVNRCRCHDPIALGHTACALRPPWAGTPETAQRHGEADTGRRTRWSTRAYLELAEAKRSGPSGAGAGWGTGQGPSGTNTGGTA